MKKHIKKIIIAFIIITLILSGIFAYRNINTNKNKLTKEEIKEIVENTKVLRVKYLVMEKNNDEYTLDDVFPAHFDDYLSFSQEYIFLSKEGDYYVSTLKDTANQKILNSVIDVDFAMNNTNGELIEDCIYDKDTYEIKIPKEYFEKEYENVNGITPIQMELLSRLSDKEIKKIPISVKTKNIFNKKIEVAKNGKNDSFKLATLKNKKNVNIYLNNSKIELEDKYFEYDKKSGTITFDINPMLVNDIKIEYSNNKFSFLSKTKAANYTLDKHSSIGVITLGSAPDPEPTTKVNKDIELVVGKDDNYNVTGNVIYVNPFVPQAHFVSGGKWSIPTEIWGELTDKLFTVAPTDTMTTVDDVIEINPKEKLGYDYDHKILFGANCIHIAIPYDASGNPTISNIGAVAGKQKFHYKVTDVSDVDKDGYKTFTAVFMLDTSKMWTGTQTGGVGQTLLGVLKFKYEAAKAKIRVQKEFKDGSSADNTITDKSGVTIGLYSDKDCKTELAHDDTDSSGLVIFKDLKINTNYYTKEIALGGKFSTNDWTMDGVCSDAINVTKEDTPQDSNGYHYVTKTITNRKKYYCYKVKKVDAENTGCEIEGVTFVNSNGTAQTTGTTGIVTFENLPYGSYTVTETTPRDTELTLHCNTTSKKYKYWNDNSSPAPAALTEMGWNGTNYTCSANPTNNLKSNRKQYFCLKVKKVDAVTGAALPGAQFTTTVGGTQVTKTTNSNGIATFMLGTNFNKGSYTVTETKAPDGYALPTEASKPVNVTTMAQGTTAADATVESNCNASETKIVTYPDSKILLNWYKETENGAAASGAEFKVSNGSSYLVVAADKENQTDASNPAITKSCYKYSSTTTDKASASVLVSDANGEVCISGLDAGTYTVEETKPAKYHTFDSKASIPVATNTVFSAKNDNNKFVDYETIFEFTKKVSSGDGDTKIIVNGQEKTLSQLTTEELKKIDFQIYKRNDDGTTNGGALSFILKDGVYEYSDNTIENPTGDLTTILHLNDSRKITVKHLEWGNYIIKEVNSKSCGGTDEDCIGYYYPDNENATSFTISKCSNSKANATSCTTSATVTQNMINTPTEITFTKKDFYKYYDEKDIVNFENDKERSDFDRIVFKLKDKNGNYLTLKKVRDNGNCLTDDSYSEYRYVYEDTTDSGGTELKTCGGHMKITNLCRGNSYTVEEISVPDDSVFVKENTESTPTSVSYTIPCKSNQITTSSNTNVINDKPTRVRFEKRDSKYNYLIPDETTTFNVYRCKKGTTCHPADGITNDMELVKFSPRSVITKDEEDPEDAEGVAGVEVYRRVSDSDVKKGAEYVTDLHPYHGILVLRYLESNYNYVLLETVAPKNYTLPIGRNAETEFTVTNTTVSVKEVDVPNQPTSLLIRKYSDDGELLEGAEFKVYEGLTCDPNLEAINQPKKLLKFKTNRDGLYESRPVTDTEIVVTCSDKNGTCSKIPDAEDTKLTYEDYEGTWAQFQETLNKKNEKIEIKAGEALIQYLEYDHCYIIEEVKAPKGYSLPKNEKDRFTMVTIERNEQYAADTFKDLVNSPTPFTFYKFDEYNSLIDGAEFKLQKLDDNKKYNDITVTEEIKNGKKYYKVDEESKNKVITTTNGSATVYYLSAGQYRIVETKPPEGKELSKNPNIATFFVDDSGNVYGNSIIVNKEKTIKIESKPEAEAELIINISTGQTVIKYGLIIALLVAVITGLMILKNKEELEEKKNERTRRKNKEK